jgi:ABC-2 type transport system permease protein
MKGIYAIFRKELSLYFVSPIAYVVVGGFLFISGFFFQTFLDIITRQALQAAMQSMQFGAPADFDIPGETMRSFFGVVGTILLFIVPMLSMGAYAEERKRGTMELLMTSPVTDLEIVLGKYLASLALFLIMLVPTMIQVAILFKASDPMPPWRLMASGYIGLLLLGGSLLALGHFLSSLTENQIIASVTTFIVFLLLWVVDAAVRGSSQGVAGQVAQYLSIIRHFDDFIRGIVDTQNLVFYLSVIALGLFLTLRSLDSLRWRRA